MILPSASCRLFGACLALAALGGVSCIQGEPLPPLPTASVAAQPLSTLPCTADRASAALDRYIELLGAKVLSSSKTYGLTTFACFPEAELTPADVRDWHRFADALVNGTSPVARVYGAGLRKSTVAAVRLDLTGARLGGPSIGRLAMDLAALGAKQPLLSAVQSAGASVAPELLRAFTSPPASELGRLNRLLLADAFPDLVVRKPVPSPATENLMYCNVLIQPRPDRVNSRVLVSCWRDGARSDVGGFDHRLIERLTMLADEQ